MNAARPAAIALAALLTVAACGGDSGPVADPADDQQPAATAGPDAPAPTDTSALPDELVGLVRPVEVSGDPLPTLETDDFTADPARGASAPVLSGEDYEGRTVRVDAFAGGPTMVVFLAHWCPHCNDEIPLINELRDDGRLPDELNVVGVSTAVSPGRPNFPPDRWLEQKDWTFPVIADDIDFEREVLVAAEAMGVSGFPFVVLIDADGLVQARWSGGRSADQFELLISGALGLG